MVTGASPPGEGVEGNGREEEGRVEGFKRGWLIVWVIDRGRRDCASRG